jgi:hypothetical protein
MENALIIVRFIWKSDCYTADDDDDDDDEAIFIIAPRGNDTNA